MEVQNQSVPAVSIVMPVFNGADVLPETLNAVFAQKAVTLELIAVDDASSDHSLEILRNYQRSEPRLRVIASSENAGAHEARKLGLREVRADWVGFVDADDLLLPEMFSRLFSVATSESEVSIVICSVHAIDAAGARIGPKVKFKEEASYEDSLLKRFCRRDFGSAMLWNKLYRRSLIQEFGLRSFSKRQDATEDTLVNIGCFAKAGKVKVIPESLYGYRKHEASATQAAQIPRRYARLLAAYVEAVKLYRVLGEPVLKEIDTLYRLQLQQRHCGVDSPQSLQAESAWLTEIVQQLVQERPSAVYELMNQGIVNPFFFEQHQPLLRQWFEVTKRMGRRLLEKK